MSAALLRAAERALRNGSTQAPNQMDSVQLARVARRRRRAAEAQRDVRAGFAARHADYLGVGHFAGVGSVDGDEDVAHTNLRGHIIWVDRGTLVQVTKATANLAVGLFLGRSADL